MKRARLLWIFRLMVACCLHNIVECRRYDRCSTYEGRSGVCVLKRFCRVASTSPTLQYTRCPGPGDHLCCPLPTPKSSQTPSTIVQVTTPGPIAAPPPLESHNPLKIEPPNLPLTSGEGERKHPDGSTGSRTSTPSREEPYRKPHGDEHSRERLNPSVPKVESDSRPRPESKDDRSFTPVESDRMKVTYSDLGREQRTEAPRRRPNRTQRPESTQENFPPPNRRNSTDSIKFSESFEASLPHPPAPACGEKPFKLFIAGGEESTEHEWPWMTAIFRRHQGVGPKTFLCGGSLINRRYILSAAHCFVNNNVILPSSLFLVRMGAHYLDQGEEYTVANLVIHQNHSGYGFFNDIALVRLASEVYFTDKIAPICLPSAAMATESFVGRMATVAGWGETIYKVRESQVLRHVTVPVVSGEDCLAAYSRVSGAAFLARGSNHVICAGLLTGGKDACMGDSGGPLMIKMKNDLWTVIGIVSLGYKCAEPEYPGVYTRVTHYLTWIYSNMKRY